MYLHVGQISGPLWVTGEQNRQTSKTDTRMCSARQGPRLNGQSDGDFGLDQSTPQQFGQGIHAQLSYHPCHRDDAADQAIMGNDSNCSAEKGLILSPMFHFFKVSPEVRNLLQQFLHTRRIVPNAVIHYRVHGIVPSVVALNFTSTVDFSTVEIMSVTFTPPVTGYPGARQITYTQLKQQDHT